MVLSSTLSRIVASLFSIAVVGVTAIDVWPMPRTLTTGTTPTNLDPEFNFNCVMNGGGVCPDPLPAAFIRYNNILFFADAPTPLPLGSITITGLNITILANLPLTLGVSENYTLTVPVNGTATLQADTQWGALRGIESFSQLFVWSGYYGTNGSQYVLDSAPVTIVDYPRWPWRSLLIDSSRHFLLPSAIMAVLDGMSYMKLNTLHWHIVDDNSWPLYLESYPLFTNGAYAPDAIYSHQDIQQIVQYANDRGIRIIPEFDGPAHADAWAKGYPEFVISCSDGQSLLNPTDQGGIYEAITGILAEVIPLFGNPDVIHFGGDEVEDLTCWNESTEVQNFMKEKGLPDVNAVRNYFESTVQSIAKSFNADSMFWEEVYDKNYSLIESSIVDIWLSFDEVAAATASGKRVVNSYSLYLDQQTPPGDLHYFWVDTWSNFYLADPTNGTNLSPEQEALILGGSLSQVCTKKILFSPSTGSLVSFFCL